LRKPTRVSPGDGQEPDSETAARGLLVLAEAELALKRFAEAEAALNAPAPASSN
jgi:hypothetical protein